MRFVHAALCAESGPEACQISATESAPGRAEGGGGALPLKLILISPLAKI